MERTSIQDLFDLRGRTAVVTGGAGFLGFQHASALAEAGCRVVLWDVAEAPLQRAAAELGSVFPGQVEAARVDIADVGSVRDAAAGVRAAHGGLHVLVNNASLTIPKGPERETTFRHFFAPFEEYPVELWDLALRVNLTGTFLVTQALAPLLLGSEGASVVNIASDVGVISPDHRIYEPNEERGYPGVSFNTTLSYSASKAALIQMTKYWATLWAKRGVRVNAISPAGVSNSQDPAFMRELTDRIPLGRMAKRHELKGALLFLASDASSFVTGHNLVVDGGRTIW